MSGSGESKTAAFVADIWPCFVATDRTDVEGGVILVTTLDRDTHDFGHLIAREVLIGGNLYRCAAVERFAHHPPWRKGETIGIFVRTPSSG